MPCACFLSQQSETGRDRALLEADAVEAMTDTGSEMAVALLWPA
jgi:hypothetical protein